MADRSAGETIEARAGVVLGALVADAAAMGLHWLYDPDRLASIAGERDPVFLSAEQRHFEGVQGFFAHDGKRSGELSQYGATLVLAMTALIANGGRPDITDYQRRFLAFFGPGGEWRGYIDRPTRGSLVNLGSAVTEETPAVSGVDDDQMPALSSVAALVAADPDHPDLEADVIKVVRVTNDNPFAIEAALITARLIRTMLAGGEVGAALVAEAERAGDMLQPLLREALARPDDDTVEIAGHFGRACHVYQGLPVVFHLVNRSDSYQDAIRNNIMAGGDSCGRSMALGAILGARFGFGSERGIPLPWLTRLADGARLFDQAYRLVGG